MDLRPLAGEAFSICLLKRTQLPATLERELEVRELLLARVARPLEHLSVENGADRRRGRFDELVRGEIQHHDRCLVFRADRRELGTERFRCQSVAEQLVKRRAMDGPLVVEGESEVLGEGALAGPVEAREPDADLSHLTAIKCVPVQVEKARERVLDVVGRLVLGDLGGQAVIVRAA